MADLVKVGDTGTGTCYSHDTPQAVTGTVASGRSGFTITNLGKLLAGHGDQVDLSCGHYGVLVSNVSDIDADGVNLCKSGCSWTNGNATTDGTITNTGSEVTEG